jgi:transcriptional regulator
MYKLPYFTEKNPEKVFEFMKKNPFVVIAGVYNDFPVATHVPLEIKKIDDKIILTGHIMKDTDHYKAFSKNQNVLIIFSGPHCYVSASWYVKKNLASTWNYMDVQAKGKIQFTNEEGTKKIIENITDQYEKSDSAAAFNKLPKDYVERLSTAIAGFNIEVESVDNTFKLSQNHDPETRRQIIENLRKTGNDNSLQIANEMEKLLM